MVSRPLQEIFDYLQNQTGTYIRAEHLCYLTTKSNEEQISENNVHQLDLWLKYEINDLQLYEAIQ